MDPQDTSHCAQHCIVKCYALTEISFKIQVSPYGCRTISKIYQCFVNRSKCCYTYQKFKQCFTFITFEEMS